MVYDIRGPGGRRLLLLEAWKAATRATSFAIVGRISGCLENAAVADRRVAAARAVCRSSVGRIIDAIGMRGGYYRRLYLYVGLAPFVSLMPVKVDVREGIDKDEIEIEAGDDALTKGWDLIAEDRMK